MPIWDSEHEPESVRLKHLAGSKQNTSFFDKRKVIPILGYQLGYPHKTSLYDDVFTLDADDDNPHDVCYDPDRNRIWVVCFTSPTRVLRINPEDLTYDRLILPAGVNLGYRIAYDGKWIWVTTNAAPAQVVRINPDTLAYDYVTLPADYDYANALCVGGVRGGTRYVWVGVHTGAAPWIPCVVLRFDPDDWPNYDELDLLALNGNWNNVRELVFDGRRVWAMGGWGGILAWIDPDTFVGTDAGTLSATCDQFFSGCWDGSYLWGGCTEGHIMKINPDTLASDIMQMALSANGNAYIHAMRSDGKYIHAVDYHNGYYYIIHPETMEYSIHETVREGRHGLCFDGTYIWIVDATSEPGVIERFMVHEPSRRVEHGRTDTFSTAAIANISVAVVFDMAFSRVPTVTVSLNDLSDKNAEVVSVEADSVTVNGFNAGCRVAAAGAGGSTARFMWIATERSTHHP